MSQTPSEQELNWMLDQVTKEVFLGTNAAFLGSLLCSHEFHWDFDGTYSETACNDGQNIWWNVKDFLRCSPGERKSTVLHELWHTGLLHFVRGEGKIPEFWIPATEWRINNNLRYDSQEVPDNGWWMVNTAIDNPKELAEEEIYELLLKNKIPAPPVSCNCHKPGEQVPSNVQLAAVVRAVQAAEIAGQAGTLPGNLKQVIKKSLEPKIPWKQVLHQWMTDLMDSGEYTWRIPDRRFQNIYLPSEEQEDGRLEHLVYFEDASGSITTEDLKVFNSEVKYIKDVLKPKKLTVVQFDTIITFEKTFNEDEEFEEIEIHGGGGTSLSPVRTWIEEHQPTAAIVFSDLECDPMEPLTRPIPTIWAAIRNQHAQVPFGKLIRLRD